MPSDLDQRVRLRETLERNLLAALKDRRLELDALLVKYDGHWHYEDRIYRFYHQSVKVFSSQGATAEIVDVLRSLLPGRELNEYFLAIVHEGTGKTFTLSDNDRWLEATRPMVEAFFHARFFLEMAVRYGRELESPPIRLPSGWAALLYLYDLR